jgi:hypothetical protein
MKSLREIENPDLYLNEQDLRLLKAYLDTEEKKRQFLLTYMYILNVGNGDAQFESENWDIGEISKSLNESQNENINEGIIGNVINFIKGKTAISKYYKGLSGAAKNYISAAKKIDNMDRDERAKYRKSRLDAYNKTVSDLDSVKKNIDDLKKDSKILQKYDSYANNKYKIKMFLTGQKTGVSLAKMKGYEDDIDKIKREQTSLEDDIKKANKEAEEAKQKVETKKREDKAKAPAETDGGEVIKDEGKAKIKKDLDALKDKKNDLKKESMKLNKKDNLSDTEVSKVQANLKNITAFDKEIVDLEKQLKEEENLPLSFFIRLETLNEYMKCLENSIGERL